MGETEYLILFLKHPYYAGIPAGQLSMVMENVIHLAEKKAEKIGAETVVSTSYREYVQEREDYAKANFYLYISKSKNGLTLAAERSGKVEKHDIESFPLFVHITTQVLHRLFRIAFDDRIGKIGRASCRERV